MGTSSICRSASCFKDYIYTNIYIYSNRIFFLDFKLSAKLL
jgi:hypothetical protein